MPTTSLRRGAALLGAALLGAALLSAAACDERGPQDITGAPAAARVKFFNFGVGTPGVNFYANDTKVTAISSADTVESTTGTASGAAAAGGFYSGLAAGQYTFSGRIAAAVDKNLAIASLPATLADGRAYSVYLSGIYNTAAKQVDGFVIEDVYPTAPAFDTIYVRFVNAISNAGPLALSLRNPTTGFEFAVGGPVAYKAGTAFVAVPGVGGVVDFVVRNAGSTAVAFSRTGVSQSGGRVYTVTARGDITVTSTTAATRPQLDNTANY